MHNSIKENMNGLLNTVSRGIAHEESEKKEYIISQKNTIDKDFLSAITFRLGFNLKDLSLKNETKLNKILYENFQGWLTHQQTIGEFAVIEIKDENIILKSIMTIYKPKSQITNQKCIVSHF